ncbi:hypothetical protein DFJ58DRAFT_865882 [Suillus subalutaceus]|uniref:uncharacterized protein n=1 Tax=Suillus subalutaceus TaxID=48586 RepID=UPI001B879E56|nr:uncharacterized protein DFJ58DRAFT_865882 [Suillus subalutaceus]KAG1876596.1 hypothetical protein DFJ58DRAFT_865882 [Suillus subalutaceus]
MPSHYPTPTLPSPSQSSHASIPALDSDTEIYAHLHNTRSPPQVRNRFLDNSLTLSLERNIRAWRNGIVFDYGVITGINSSAFSEPVARLLTSEEARRDFGIWGDWISNVARLPPDAYTQLALQLAWYRSRRFLVVTYETALTRMFNAGLTGCVRSASAEESDSVKAAKEWGRGAECVHICFLLGLSLEFKSHRFPEKHTHPLFTDPLFSRSQEWKLSTSGLSAGDQFRGTGWEDRYGINYLIAPHRIKFCVESKLSSLLTSTNKFKQHIADAVRDMRVICEAGELELKDRTKKSVDGVSTGVHARLSCLVQAGGIDQDNRKRSNTLVGSIEVC